MSQRDDDFSAATKRTLAERVSFQCSFPGCHQTTIGPSEEGIEATSSVGMACHIAAASSGPGSRRFDAGMSSEERRSISNGIWMCYTHGRLIDTDEVLYSPKRLQEWKQLAEERARIALEGNGNAGASSVLRERWLNALGALHSLIVHMIPCRTHEEQNWEDAMILTGSRMPEHEQSLRHFNATYGGFLPNDVMQSLLEAISKANESNLPSPITSADDLNNEQIKNGAFAAQMIEFLELAKSRLRVRVF